MHSNKYTIVYAVGLTVAVAVSLALAATGLAPRQEANAAYARRTAILETVMEVEPSRVEEDYRAFITERVFDYAGNEVDGVAAFELDIVREARKAPEERLYPVYQFERTGTTRFIVPMRGAGLWGPISAYLALADDLATISGVSFDHEKETPGLGAEITTPAFENQFEGKRVVDETGTFRPVEVVKTGRGGGSHTVDGLTGATMTMNGVTKMFAEELARYQEVFEELGQ